ncbi:Fungal specific transcription factor domain-containing protein 52 [Elsinoe fawcettii]|nr:Fungal specific transcription factor domain-containing protein 52 [Elsinoe fawcettii]
MPRPKVRPDKRLRVAQACEPCKASKRRCNSGHPCSNCERRAITPSCIYLDRPTRKRDASTAFSHASAEASGTVPTPPASVDPSAAQPRLMLTNAGQNVYIGDNAALSFLQFLRKTLRHYAGPSPFTENRNRHTLLELPPKKYTGKDLVDDLDRQEKVELVRYFRDASSGFLYLHTDQDIASMLVATELVSPRSDGVPTDTEDDGNIALYAMIAVGAMCRSEDVKDKEIAAKYLGLAQKTVFRDMLHDPSLDMVINFLLLTYCMLCACRRNTGAIYLGIAAQAAKILGLHVPKLYENLPVEARQLRTRVWKSMKIMDVQCNAILGRPGSTLRAQSPHQACVAESGASFRALIIDANYDCCLALEDIYRNMSEQGTITTDVAEKYLLKLRQWIQSLPEELRETVRGSVAVDTEQNHRELAIGKVHIACSYYFGVVFITRQFLVREVTEELRDQHTTSDEPNTPIAEPTLCHKLAQVCIDAAMCNIQTSSKAARAGLLLGNMAILAAWQFSAGLSLGFPQMVQLGISQPEIWATFASCKQVLRHIAGLSAQAQRYLELLSSFGDAVEAYHNDVVISQQPHDSEYLEQIFSFEPVPDTAGFDSPTIPNETVASTIDAADTGITTASDFDFPGFLSKDSLDWSMANDEFGLPVIWDLPSGFYD